MLNVAGKKSSIYNEFRILCMDYVRGVVVAQESFIFLSCSYPTYRPIHGSQSS
jgi:hypothetical protein